MLKIINFLWVFLKYRLKSASPFAKKKIPLSLYFLPCKEMYVLLQVSSCFYVLITPQALFCCASKA